MVNAPAEGTAVTFVRWGELCIGRVSVVIGETDNYFAEFDVTTDAPGPCWAFAVAHEGSTWLRGAYPFRHKLARALLAAEALRR